MADDILDRVRSFATRGDEQPVEDSEAEPAGAETPEPEAQEMAMSDAQAGLGLQEGSGALAPAGIIRACPIPSGAVIFGELTSAFVDGPRLIRFLADRRHTGAVVDAGRTRVQVALLYEGAAVGLVAVGDGSTRRVDTMSLPAPGSGDEHQLTVLTYRPEITLALAQHAYERIQRVILENRLPPGTPVAEPRLAQEFAISRTALRWRRHEPTYSVRFDAAELWSDGQHGVCVHVDLWDSYLEPA